MSSRTYKIVLSLLLCISAIGLTWLAVPRVKTYLKGAKIAREKAARVERKLSESNAVVAKVEARKNFDETAGATTIDLGSHINASLNSSFVPRNAEGNNLAELEEGTKTLAGVPFHIRGSIQLSGRDLRLYSKASFPLEVTNIQVSASCYKLHILHGSYFVKNLGMRIAKLVLHYENGATEVIPIISGQHVLDWWAPNYETGVREDWRAVSATGSELAWVGSNAYIRKRQPHLSLRLFKSTFGNPRPDLKIATIDYVSMDTYSAPFLLGLTVE